MQYEVSTPAEYLKSLDTDWRKEKLEVLRSLIAEHASDFNECIHYKMLGYQDDEGFIFHLNAQKNYVSFYVGDADKIDPTRSLWGNADVGKGCVRFKKSVEVDTEKMGQFIEKAVELWNRGENRGC